MGDTVHSLARSLPWLSLALGSALFQVLRNMAMKRIGHALDETISVWGRFTFILPFAALPLFFTGIPRLGAGVWLYAALFGVCQLIATQFLAIALKAGEISLVTAIWKLSLVFLVVWGFFTLHEVPSLLGLVGMLVSVAGVYLINVERARVSLWAPLVSLAADKGQRYTVLSALLYAPNVVLIKKVALLSSPAFAVFVGYFFCAGFITPLALLRSRRHFAQLGKHWWNFVALGLCAAVSTQLGTTAYTLTLSSYVEAVKQLEVVLALVVGYFVFREGARIRMIWFGCSVMLAGLVLLMLGQAK